MDLPQRAQRAAKDTKGILTDWLWGAAPRPGREKFSLHPRHVCDVPSRRPQEMQEIQEIQERPCGGGAAGPPRRTENGEQRTENVGDKEIAEQRNQTSKPLSFQTSTCPCTPGTSATRHQDDHRRFRRCRRYRSARQAGDRRNRFSGNDRSARDGHVSEGRRAER